MKMATLVFAALLLAIGGGLLVIGISSQFKPTLSNTSSALNFPTPLPVLERGTYRVSPKKMWTETDEQIVSGDEVTIVATGKVSTSNIERDAAYKWVGPDGWGYTPTWFYGPYDQPDESKPKTQFKLILGPETSLMALIGKVGENGTPFLIGSSYRFRANNSGKLYLGVNESLVGPKGEPSLEGGQYWQENLGDFTAKVQVAR